MESRPKAEAAELVAENLRDWLRLPTRGTQGRCFWDFIDKTSSAAGCWLWTRTTNVAGYGVWRKKLAHRLSLASAIGSIPAGKFALHRCDNPPCCNPDHLYVGTTVENLRDARERGRWVHPRSALTHCQHGHLLEGENLILVDRGAGQHHRRCRTCENKAKAARATRTRRQRGIPVRTNFLTEADIARIRSLRSSGLTQRQIAAETGRSVDTVARTLKEKAS